MLFNDSKKYYSYTRTHKQLQNKIMYFLYRERQSFTQEYSCVKLLRVPEFKIRESITILYDRYFFETFLIMHNIEICPILVRDGTKNNPQEVEIPHSPLTAK